MASWVLEFFPPGLWARVPLLSNIQLIRFALPVSLCVGLLLAASIDGWWSATARWWPTAGGTGRRTVARVTVLAAVGLAFVPLVADYSLPFRVTAATVPAWFEHEASRLPPGTAVLTVPFAFFIASRPMAWQAEVHDSFDLVGGWAFVPGGNGVDDEMVSAPVGPVAALRSLSDDPLGVTPAQQQTIRAAVIRWRPLAIVVIPPYAAPGAVAAVTATLGLAPTRSDGLWVWHITRTTRLGPLVDPSTIRP
jgi:hypothetical protein